MKWFTPSFRRSRSKLRTQVSDEVSGELEAGFGLCRTKLRKALRRKSDAAKLHSPPVKAPSDGAEARNDATRSAP